MKIIKKENLYQGFLTLERWHILLPNQAKITREVIVKRDAVAIVAVDVEGKLYMTKQPRAGRNSLASVEIPAGLIDEGETPEEAARRELLEETGCKCEKLERLGKYIADPATATPITYLYIAIGCTKIQELHLDEDEYLESMLLDKQEVYEQIEQENIYDANTLIGISKAKEKGWL